ncbi:hypothetical protein VOLCADRAFT_95012 [Volvox carteri f. nagariensis]|uniref:Uncharacterized protein n=1 Tax=Volvox carteri f. nagariensis TaxID=3068 RepID=D8U6D3_VOLCA|nr:uncharacterized protein VOLCADRAFT_95012 [Volvox carteri f. nagariensis]EFJ44696.1 hypothetical protein VOLCADRAFT_95012 [Volvox carteri f. nagariensis]|eukprot:XP_002954272.1 hypothetical protein VOLCADRAFT_95012 [Volvox carteri f. nagariensis]
MDAITRVSYYFPTHTLTVFQILANLVINDSSYCHDQERALVIAMLVLFSVVCFFVSFTDTYTAFDGQKFWVLIMPVYGPLCFSLPTEEDKDRVYEYYYAKGRDFVHAVLSTAAFVLIILFTNPVCMCIFPSGKQDGTSQFDAAIVRTVPVVVALICGMVMMCLGPPRQMIGFQNVPESTPAGERPMAPNPVYGGSQGDYPPGIPEGDDYESGPGLAHGGGGPMTKSTSQEGPGGLVASKSISRSIGGDLGPPRESYVSSQYRLSMQPGRQSTRVPGPSPKSGDYGTSDGGFSSGGYRQE